MIQGNMPIRKLENIIIQYPSELKLLMEATSNGSDGINLSELPPQFSWDSFMALMQRHQMTSQVFPALSYQRDKIPAGIYESIKAIHRHNTQRALAHIEQTIRLQKLLNRENIPALFIKGVVLSQMIYENPVSKNSIDIDILIPFEHTAKTAELLTDLGYRMTYPETPLSDQQKKINYRISHHYEFYHLEKGVRVELHWKMINPYQLLPLSFNRLYRQGTQVNLNEHPVKTLCAEDYILYLAVHGAKHRWYNLAWMKDFSTMLGKAASEVQMNILQRSLKLGLEKCFIQSCLLSKLLYNTVIPEEILKQANKARHLTDAPLKAIQRPRPTIGSNKLKNLSYQFRLRKSLRYKLTLLFRLRTHHSDWAQIKLPGWLFFLYYPLRPVLWLLGKKDKWFTRQQE